VSKVKRIDDGDVKDREMEGILINHGEEGISSEDWRGTYHPVIQKY
jgi:hypothetical protein